MERELYRLEIHELALANLDWVKVVSPKDQKLVKKLMLELDSGESESIALALENEAD